MKEFLHILKKTRMFSGITEEEIEGMLSCLDARTVFFKKGEYVLRSGDAVKDIHMLVKGKAHIVRDDYWGNRSILGQVLEGEMFAEAYVSPRSGNLRYDVEAIEDCTVMLFDVKCVLSPCCNACSFHGRVTQNLFFAVSEKNTLLVQKLSHMSKRTTREKLISYLSEQSDKNNSAYFEIPFNRQQLADFLSVDRSAMSNELCKMRDEGMLEFEKNRFKLIVNNG